MSLVEERLVHQSLPVSRRRDGQLPVAWALGTAVAWVVGLQLMTVLEPRPLHPDAVPAVLVTALAFVLNGALLVAAVGLVRRARWACWCWPAPVF